MKNRSLMRKSLTQFILCVAVLLVCATPLFYILTKNYYAEDMIEVIEAVQQGKPVPPVDLEEDILHGIVLQFVLIAGILGAAIVLTLRFISGRLWRPFEGTLQAMESFHLEEGKVPRLPDDCGIEEFSRLNSGLEKLMNESLASYRVQKEFTENASHELQTPLAVFQSKLDLLLQQPQLTQDEAAIIQDLYRMSGRMGRLNRNLLLLAKMDNAQFSKTETDVVEVVDELRPYFENLASGIHLKMDIGTESLKVQANRSLLESLLNNLIVNAVRHNRPDGAIRLRLTGSFLTVSNTSDTPALDSTQIFNRFYRTAGNAEGNGLGLSIVKAICVYHGWSITYSYDNGQHIFSVKFS